MRTVWIALLLIVACNNSKRPERAPPPPSPGSATVTIDAAVVASVPELTNGCAAYAEAQCGLFERCFQDWGRRTFGDHAACLEYHLGQCHASWSVPGSRVDDASLARCASAIEHSGCNYVYGDHDEAACAPPAGVLGTAAACIQNAQCQSGMCTRATGSSCGTCAAEAPTEGKRCARGLSCAPGLHCIASGVCAPPGKLGDSCIGSFDCEMVLECDHGTCQKQRVPGDPCNDAHVEEQCPGYLFCRGGTCRLPPTVGAGHACTGGDYVPDGDRPCAPGLVCGGDENHPTCVPRLKPGEACSTDPTLCPLWAPCVGGRCTVPTMKMCTQPR